MRPNGTAIRRPSTEKRGTSAVVGVVVLTAVTVVAAAAVGTVAFDLRGQLAEPAPVATFDARAETVSFSDPGTTRSKTVVVVTHENGETIDADNLVVTVNGERAWDVSGLDGSYGRTVEPLASVESLSVGSAFRIVLWENEYGDYPVSDGELELYYSGGCRWVFRDFDASDDCAMSGDEVGDGDTVEIIYRFPNSGKTVVLDSETV